MVLAAAFGWWAGRLRRSRRGRAARLDELEAELDHLRGELAETQERLDFAERLLAQSAERRPPGLER